MDGHQKQSPAQRVTTAIIEKLEAGTRPWAQPWQGANIHRPLRVCGTPYRSINRLTLSMLAIGRGYSSPYWMTFGAAIERGAHVRRGEKGSLVVYSGKTAGKAAASGDDAAASEVYGQRHGEPEPKKSKGGWFMSASTVFCCDQIDGLSDEFFPEPPPPPRPASEQLDEFMTWVGALGAHVEHGGVQPCYVPSRDVVIMPERSRFPCDNSYLATHSHELSHWSGGPSRLARDFGSRFNDQARVAEELLAEMTAALLGSVFGHSADHLDSHAGYIGAWLACCAPTIEQSFILPRAPRLRRSGF